MKTHSGCSKKYENHTIKEIYMFDMQAQKETYSPTEQIS